MDMVLLKPAVKIILINSLSDKQVQIKMGIDKSVKCLIEVKSSWCLLKFWCWI